VKSTVTPSGHSRWRWLAHDGVKFITCLKLMARCGAQTLSGGECQQIVKDGCERCWLHNGQQCSVCLSYMNDRSRTRVLDCNHEFHIKCLDRWKTTCRGPDPTCPMCRMPFDVPTYRCRLIIEKTRDGTLSITEFLSQNVNSIIERFGLDFRQLLPNNVDRLLTDIRFDIDPTEDLRTVLTDLGLPHPSSHSD